MIASILKILSALVTMIERIRVSRKQKEKQDDRDALEDNPDLWFNQHFGGMHDKPIDNNADKTNDTDSTER